jgi:tetratricopeptide (TPR) repeat protein
MLPVIETIQEALLKQQAGDLAGAAGLFAQLAQHYPDCAEAYYGQGMVAYEQGEYAQAIGLIRKALAIVGDYAKYYNGLGNVYHRQGNLKEAAEAYERALALEPEHYEVLHNLGLLWLQQGQPAQAVQALTRALEICPTQPTVLVQLANALGQIDQPQAAIEMCQEALALDPALAEAHFVMAYHYQKLEEERLNAGQTEGMGFYPQIVNHYLDGLKLNPVDVQAYYNLGNAFKQHDQLDEAVFCYENALELDPDFAAAQNNLGYVYRARGQLEQAIACYRETLRINPTFQEAQFNLAAALLLCGDFQAGWPAYEARQARRTMVAAETHPLWQGEVFRGKTLLVRSEQGFGDTLQFVRYLPQVKALGGTVILECQSGLETLLAGCAGVDRVIERDDPLADHEYDLFVPLLSLPAIFQTDATSIPSHCPYLMPDPGRMADWRERLDQLSPPDGLSPRQRIGIVWAGGLHNQNYRMRATTVDPFVSLAKVPGCQLFSLQLEPDGRHHAAAYQQLLQSAGIVPLAHHLTDFAETAAVVSVLDRVITIDTSVAHLAGGLGRPVWTLLPKVPDWRWLLSGEGSPWYPTMRLFRQGEDGQWGPVFQAVEAALRSL